MLVRKKETRTSGDSNCVFVLVCFGACGSSEVYCLVYLLVSLTGIWDNGGFYLYACFVMDGHEQHYRAFLI